MVKEDIKKSALDREQRQHNHVNFEALWLLDDRDMERELLRGLNLLDLRNI